MSNKITLFFASASLLVSLLAAGYGVSAWFQLLYQEPLVLATPISQDDFDSPVYVAFTLRREATLTMVATASNLVYVPAKLNGTPLDGAGLRLEITVDNEPCANNEHSEDAPVSDGDGRRRMKIDATCTKELGPGRHFARLLATALGNCVSHDQSPDTCRTSRIRGAYSLIE